jgi:cyclopropane-fatty-acyl-phospholipid synthase
MERVEGCGVTISREQLALAHQRARRAELEERVRFILKLYREIRRIVSVGMFEHVGVPKLCRFFQKIRELLSADGVVLIHSIGRINGPDITNAWTRKYIFPGGHTPALSEVAPAIERAGPVSHRFGDPAPALRRNASSLARAFSGVPPPRRPHLR